jgi:hypothetical protein
VDIINHNPEPTAIAIHHHNHPTGSLLGSQSQVFIEENYRQEILSQAIERVLSYPA